MITLHDKFQYFFFTFFIINIYCYNTINPTWVTNNLFRSGNLNFINNNINSAKLLTYNLTFTSSLTGIPKLAFAFKTHQGYNNYFTLINFDLRKQTLSESVVTLTYQMYNNTKSYKIDVCYFAIDPSFPYHMNAFHNVHLNYSSGNLMTFNNKFSVPIIHVQIINYTKQAIGQIYKTFTTNPITSNKIALFHNSMYFQGDSSSKLQIITTWAILNSSYYQLKVQFQKNSLMYRLAFSIIIFNDDNVIDSKSYQAIYQYMELDYGNYYRALQPKFAENFILGILDFRTYYACNNAVFQWYWNFNTNYRTGVPFQVTFFIPYSAYGPSYGFTTMRAYLFYIKTWACNNGSYNYFNLTTNLCQNGCPNYYYQNYTARWCDKCYYACIQCSVPSDNSPNTCIQCQSGVNRIYNNASCICNAGYFDDFYSPICRLCNSVDLNCVNCSYPYNSSKTSEDYQLFFNTSNWRLNILPSFSCIQCKTNYFLNLTSRLCGTCNIANCTACLNLTACSICNATALTIKYTDNKCYVCNITKCTLCSSNNVCVQCPTAYDLISNQCIACNVGCTCGGYKLPKVNGACSTICGDGLKVGIQQCDDSNNISHDGCSSLCKIEICSQNCSCDGWIVPWVTTNNSCSTKCGDGIKKGIQQCDDGNTQNHDNCSSMCKIQKCSQSCNCDGWTHPFIEESNSCTTICGDGIVRGEEECDDNNFKNYDGCTQCVIQKVFLKQATTTYVSLIIFFSGLKIAGIQVLNVLQHLQLLLKIYQIQTFQISYFIHGYSNTHTFFIPVSQHNQFLKKFNFMFQIIFILFTLGLLIEFVAFLFVKKSKIANSYVTENKLKQYQQKQTKKMFDIEYINEHDKKQINLQIQNQQQNETSNETQNQNNIDNSNENEANYNLTQKSQIQKPKLTIKTLKNTRFKFIRSFIRQITFDFIINCLIIFIFALTNQIKYHDYKQLLEPGSIITIVLMFIFIAIFIVLCSSHTLIFGQNQMKFQQKKAIDYWILLLSQKFMFSLLVNFRQAWSLYAMISIKAIMIISFIFGNIWACQAQQYRNLVIQFIHFFIILIFTLAQISQNDPKSKLRQLKNISGYFYFGLIGILLVSMFGFYIRQIINSCMADYREEIQQQQEEQEQQIQQEKMIQENKINTKKTEKIDQTSSQLVKNQSNLSVQTLKINNKNNNKSQYKLKINNKNYQQAFSHQNASNNDEDQSIQNQSYNHKRPKRFNIKNLNLNDNSNSNDQQNKNKKNINFKSIKSLSKIKKFMSSQRREKNNIIMSKIDLNSMNNDNIIKTSYSSKKIQRFSNQDYGRDKIHNTNNNNILKFNIQ